MDVIFVRHGQAEDFSPSGGDYGRRLTDKGWKQAAAVGELLRRMELVPDLVLSSPLARAQETATGIMQAAQLSGQPVIQEWLGFDMYPEGTMQELAALPGEIGRVVLVGHEPTFSGMMGWLLGATDSYVEVKKASVARFFLRPPSRSFAELKMLIPSKALLA